MEYAFSFFVKDSRAGPVPSTGPSVQWVSARWEEDGCGATCAACPHHPPPLAQLALWAPGVFYVELQMQRHGSLPYPAQALGGRVWVRAAAVTVPLPEHTRVTQLLRSQGARVYLEAAGSPVAAGALPRCCALWLPPSVHLGASTGVVADLSTGLVYPAGHQGPAPACVPACPLRGAVLTVRGGPFPVAQFHKEAGGCARVLVLTRPALVPQWEHRVREKSPPCRVVTYHDIHHFVQYDMKKLLPPSATASSDNFVQTLALLRSLHADMAPLVARAPLLALWCQPWDQVWMDEETLSPPHVLAPCQHIAARWTWIVRGDAPLTHRDMRAHAHQLGVPAPLAQSPWFPFQWTSHACVDLGPGLPVYDNTPPAARTTWLHLPRAWHAEYAAASTTLQRLAVCVGVARAPHFRLCSSIKQAGQHRRKRQRASAGTEYTKDAATPPLHFFQQQLAATSDNACPICMEDLPPPAAAGGAVLLRCGHRLCLPCARRLQSRTPPAARCPQCRASLASASSMYVLLPDTDESKESTVERVYGPKLARIWRLLAELDRKREPALLVGQLGARHMRRVALLLRQLGLPCACAAGSARFQAAEVRRFQGGACPRLLLAAHQMRGLELPAARHVVFLHALVEERPVRAASRWVAGCALHPGGAQHHHFPLRRTVEDVLLQAA